MVPDAARRRVLLRQTFRWCAGWLLCGAATLSAFAQEEPAAPAKDAAPAATATDGKTPAGPLDQLKVRSAEDRWELLNKSWRQTRKPAQRPAPVRPPIETLPEETAPEIGSENLAPAPLPSDDPVPSFAPSQRRLRTTPVPFDSALQPSPRGTISDLEAAAEADGQEYPEPVRDPRLLKRIGEIDPFSMPPEPGQLPEEISLRTAAYTGREMAHSTYHWEASNLYHYPLYFSDNDFERNGHSYHPAIQPLVSVGRFAVQGVTLPYAMTLNPVDKPMYTLGHYRPGDFAPYKFYQIPWNKKAAFNQAAVTTGFIYLLP